MLAPTATAVLISIRPEWCEKIITGEKTFEVRKTKPKLEPPFKCYIYMTKGFASYAVANGMWAHNNGGMCVISEFICDEIRDCRDLHLEDAAMTVEQWLDYTNGHKGPTYGWHISHLKVFDRPLSLGDLSRPCPNGLFCESCAMYNHFSDCCGNKALKVKRAPQSWCYVMGRAMLAPTV